MNWYRYAKEQDNKPYKLVKRIIDNFGPPIEVIEARTLNDLYLGDERWAKMLFRKHSFDPNSFISYEDSDVACAAYDTDLNRWFGWSHRAMNDFETKQEALNFAESMA